MIKKISNTYNLLLCHNWPPNRLSRCPLPLLRSRLPLPIWLGSNQWLTNGLLCHLHKDACPSSPTFIWRNIFNFYTPTIYVYHCLLFLSPRQIRVLLIWHPIDLQTNVNLILMKIGSLWLNQVIQSIIQRDQTGFMPSKNTPTKIFVHEFTSLPWLSEHQDLEESGCSKSIRFCWMGLFVVNVTQLWVWLLI